MFLPPGQQGRGYGPAQRGAGWWCKGGPSPSGTLKASCTSIPIVSQASQQAAMQQMRVVDLWILLAAHPCLGKQTEGIFESFLTKGAGW